MGAPPARGGLPLSRDALTRLVGAVLAEQHDEWTEGRRYLGLDVLGRARLTPLPGGAATDPDTAQEVSTDPLQALTA